LNLQSEHYNFSSVFSLAETTGIVPGTPHCGGTDEQGFNTPSYSLVSDKIKTAVAICAAVVWRCCHYWAKKQKANGSPLSGETPLAAMCSVPACQNRIAPSSIVPRA